MTKPLSQRDGMAAPFDHAKNIVIGDARVVYIERNGTGIPGWALPGRKWTTDEWEALRVATAMDKLIRG